jgi:hypothetical protein
MHYAVLTPIYDRFGDGYRVSWHQIGLASSMEDAKRKFGGHPVLEMARG